MKADLPRITILMAGNTLPAIRSRFGEFHQWYQERAGLPAHYNVVTLYNGEPLPDWTASDGWIISGASESVYQDLPWLPDAKIKIVAAVEAGHAVLGVCFGHQLLAAALGGRVEPDPLGWELGSSIIELTGAGVTEGLFNGFDKRFPVYETHRDVVTDLPHGSIVLATAERGLQAFRIGERAYGVQFHPEFNLPIARMYVELRDHEGIAASDPLDPKADDSRRVLTNFIKYLQA
ncbi:MAG: gamma-glutamyl-gamma-aminobutyrate hydrolase family protein [Candidatus Neomarinimicrobiota bacterium]